MHYATWSDLILVRHYDFRGVDITPIISKVFEHCILDKFGSFFSNCNPQFGFKKGSRCRNAIYSVQKMLTRFLIQVALQIYAQ